jgi:hypothetical protein
MYHKILIFNIMINELLQDLPVKRYIGSTNQDFIKLELVKFS